MSEFWQFVVYFVIWQSGRAYYCTLNGKESFWTIFFVRSKYLRRDAEQVAYRNTQHGALGLWHSVGLCTLCFILLFDHWDETWDEWFGFRLPSHDAGRIYTPIFPELICLGYFVSDLTFISDFPLYFNHHVVSIVLLLICFFQVEMRFCGITTIFMAEVGGVMLSLYLRFRSFTSYCVFLVVYAISRVFFTIWSYRMWESNTKNHRLVDDFAAAGTLVLSAINWHFWYMNLRKFPRKLKEAGLVK